MALSLSATLAQNKKFSLLHSFSGSDGNLPTWVIQTSDSSIWGVTNSGGGALPGGGVLYKIDPSGNFAVVHTFLDKPDGATPGKLIQAKDGSIYGVTATGGSNSAGTVYRVDTAGNYSVLHSFNGASEGKSPNFVMQAADGLFYGTTSFIGSPPANGTLFRMDAAGNVVSLHTFQQGLDGANPNSVVQAGDGLLYGICRQGGALGGGALGIGTFWRSDLAGNVTLLHVFPPKSLNGSEPTEPLGVVLASDGLFYGASNKGGRASLGTIFRVDTTGVVSTLHSFDDHAQDGSDPETNFTLGRDGFFYGTTEGGGLPVDNTLRSGVVYRADTTGHVWVLHTFTGGDGGVPFAPAFLGTRKTVYATAQFQGPLAHGVTASLSLKANIPIAALTLNPGTVKGGQSATATLTLAKPAGSRGQVVQIYGTALLIPPASITVPAGQTMASFTVNTFSNSINSDQALTAYIGDVGLSSPLILVP